MKIRRSNERGYADHGWLRSYHTFSFANYMDPNHMGFRALRVINEDRVAPGHGFGAHPHRDMEIISYVLDGEMEHKDNMGNGEVMRPGDVQRMSAGTGVLHSEFNHSESEPLHLLQIWIFPDAKGYEPRYLDRHFSAEERRDTLRLIASSDADADALPIRQDAHVYAALLSSGKAVEHALGAGRGAWIQVARGALDANGESLAAGDGARVEDVATLTIRATEDAEFLLFDLG